MKKMIPLLLALLLLTACGAQGAGERPADTQLPAAQTPAAPEETEEPVMITDPVEATEKPPVMSDTVVTLDGLNSYLRLTLPEGWTWTAGDETSGQSIIFMESSSPTSLVLHAPTDDGFQITLVFWESFGMCGTGVEFKKIALPNGLTGTLATEAGDNVFWTLILPASPDQFTIQIYAPQESIDAHQAEIDAMLDTLQIGVLAHPQTVTPPTVGK